MRRLRRPAAVLPPLLLALAVAATTSCSAAGSSAGSGPPATVAAPTPAPTPVAATGDPAPAPGPDDGGPFDTTAHSTTDPASIWVVVNKRHPVAPGDFRPAVSLVRGYQVADAAAEPLTRLLDDADAAGLGFKIASAFRSYDYQRSVYDSIVASRGAAAADRVSARPGFSEHQTGLAADLVTPVDPACDFDACFARTPGGRWLAEHAWSYGFVVRYPEGKEGVTGYAPEPWHLRYVGKPLAAEMHDSGVTTLEEVFGVAGGDYR